MAKFNTTTAFQQRVHQAIEYPPTDNRFSIRLPDDEREDLTARGYRSWKAASQISLRLRSDCGKGYLSQAKSTPSICKIRKTAHSPLSGVPLPPLTRFTLS